MRLCHGLVVPAVLLALVAGCASSTTTMTGGPDPKTPLGAKDDANPKKSDESGGTDDSKPKATDGPELLPLPPEKK